MALSGFRVGVVQDGAGLFDLAGRDADGFSSFFAVLSKAPDGAFDFLSGFTDSLI